MAGLRFRRQYPIGRFIADFYCYEARLVVEVDGGVHDEPAQAAYDRERDSLFASLGLSVIRVSNGDVIEKLPLVLERIRTAAQLSQPC